MEYAPPALFIAWRDPETRRILPVGRLLRLVAPLAGYEFTYVRGALVAENHGFQPFIAFPDLKKVYRSRELLPFFKNRVLSPSRPDYEQYIEALTLNAETAEPMTLLGLSGGRRATDLIEIFPDWARDERSPSMRTRFLVRGVQHVAGAEERIASLHEGDVLHCVLDPQNPVNPKAIKLRTVDGMIVGYIPDYLAGDIAELLERDAEIAVRVLRTNPPPVPRHHRVLCAMQVDDAGETAGFRGDVFTPIADGATDIDADASTAAARTFVAR